MRYSILYRIAFCHPAGPAEEVRALVKQLDSENIFARALETNGVPYHSPVLDPLLKELDECEHPSAFMPPQPNHANASHRYLLQMLHYLGESRSCTARIERPMRNWCHLS